MLSRSFLPAVATFAALTLTVLLPGVAAAQSSNSSYRGYRIDLSETSGRQDAAAIADALRHQIDIVESVGLNARVLDFFHTVPITVADGACRNLGHPQACYVPPGGVKVPPIVLDAQRPIILHEMLHAYHLRMMPQGVQNPDILQFYNRAKNRRYYPEGEYLLTNEKEFFAMTASVFLYGKAAREPYTRDNLKQKQPVYFKFLEDLFGVRSDASPGPSPSPPTPSPTLVPPPSPSQPPTPSNKENSLDPYEDF